MGDEVPPAPPKPVTVGQSSFNIVPGGIVATRLSGGTPPYSFKSRGDTNVAVPSIAFDSLKIRAVALGSSTIIVRDAGSPELTVTVTVTITELAVGQSTFNLTVGDSALTSISGGTPPYSIVSNSNPTKTDATIVASTLKIRALSVGNAVVVIGDNHSPQRRDTVNISISPVVVSFSAQVQPIFTANCANGVCHPGSGSPFPLGAGASYDNLVGVDATTGPCRPIRRVQAGNADASALIKRLEGTCGAQMPLGVPPLSSSQIQVIRDWIEQGAARN